MAGRSEERGYGFWLFVAFVIIVFLLPPVTSERGFVWGPETGELVSRILAFAAFRYTEIAIGIRILTVALLVSLIRYGGKAGRPFSAFVAGNYILIAFLQSMAIIENYGLSIILSNLLIFIFIGVVWAKEALRPKSDFTFERLPWWRYWPIPLAFLAYWFPADIYGRPDFNPLYLLTSDYGVAFCLTTPAIVTILTLIYPRVNMKVLSATCYAGLLYGILNVAFGIITAAWWSSGILHIPLLTISIWGLALPRIAKHCTF